MKRYSFDSLRVDIETNLQDTSIELDSVKRLMDIDKKKRG